MKRVAIVVEGPTDKAFFLSLSDWFKLRGLSPSCHTAQCRDRLVKNAERHTSVARAQGADLVLLVIDQHQDICSPTTAGLLSSVCASDVLVVVVSRCLEAWFLADENALRKASGIPYNRSGYTDDLLDPVGTIQQHFYKAIKQHLTKAEIARRITPHFDLEAAKSGSRSLARLAAKLRTISAS